MIDLSNNKFNDKMAEVVAQILMKTDAIHFHGGGISEIGVGKLAGKILETKKFVRL